MSEHRLQSLLEPRAIALVGASPKTETFGWTSYRALVDAGYDGEIFLVNPRYDKIDGRRCVASLLDVPGIDHAILNVSNARLEALLDQAIEAGVGAVTIFASGYLEGDRAPLLLERMRRKAADAGLHVCGGNGTGFWNRDHKVQCSLIGRPLEAAGLDGVDRSIRLGVWRHAANGRTAFVQSQRIHRTGNRYDHRGLLGLRHRTSDDPSRRALHGNHSRSRRLSQRRAQSE